MKRILLGLAAAAALTLSMPEKTDAADFFFGVSSGYRGYGVSAYPYPYSAARARLPYYSRHVAPHVLPHRAPRVVPRRVYVPATPRCYTSPYASPYRAPSRSGASAFFRF